MEDDRLENLLLGSSSSDEEPAPDQVPVGGLPNHSTDFRAQLAAPFNPIPAAQAHAPAPVSQAAGASVAATPAASPPPNKGTLILDPTAVLASQQQKAAASRPASADQNAFAGTATSSAPRAMPQQNSVMPAHSGGMMYRPVASSAPGQPSAQPSQVNRPAAPVSNFTYIQELLAFADKRWQQTNQVHKCKQARNLVQQYKTARIQATDKSQENSKAAPSQQQFQAALSKLVGPDLTHEFNLLHRSPGQIQGMSSAQSLQMPPQQMPGQQIGNSMQPQGTATARTAVSQPQVRLTQPQHPQILQQGMVRPPAAASSFPNASQGFVKQEPAAGMMSGAHPPMQHPQQNGQHNPGFRPQAVGMQQQQQHQWLQQQQQQQQQGGLSGQAQPQLQMQGPGSAQLSAARLSGAKRPAAAAPGAPANKKVKQEDDPDEQNVLFAAGVDEEAEQEALMLLGQPAANRGPAPPAPRILNSHPLQAKVQKALQQYSLQGVHGTLQPYLNQAIWQHLEGIVTQACKMASQRADLSRKQEGMQVTTDVRKALGDKARIEKEKALAKEELEKKLLLEASKAKDGDEDVQRKVKEVQKEELEKQNRAQTNSAIGAALGGGARWKNWGKKTPGTAAKPTEVGAAAKPGGGGTLAAKAAAAAAAKAAASLPGTTPAAQPPSTRALLPPSRMVTEGQIVGLKDIIAVMERHPVYCKSDMLYRMYDRLD